MFELEMIRFENINILSVLILKLLKFHSYITNIKRFKLKTKQFEVKSKLLIV